MFPIHRIFLVDPLAAKYTVPLIICYKDQSGHKMLNSSGKVALSMEDKATLPALFPVSADFSSSPT